MLTRRCGQLVIALKFCLLSLVVQGCSTFWTRPKDKTREQRMADFSTKDWQVSGSVTVRWNQAMVPFIESEKDQDLPYALGRIQAHLRWGQLEVLKRMAHGRLAEMAGPFYLPAFDHILRVINLKKSARLSYEALEAHHRLWVDRFTQGLNDAMSSARQTPPEFAFFRLQRERWTPIDVMSVSRLAALDANWGPYFQFLKLRKEKGWQGYWTRYARDGERSLATVGDGEPFGYNQIWSSLSRSGSNSFVVHGDRSQSESALIANDPHLGILAPNIWILAGYKSPSHHAVGLMFPGVPVINIGRNAHIAWGGTYMRTLSSHLFITDEEEVTSTRTERIKVRGWWNKKVKVRETEKGPILTDVPRFRNGEKALALSWVGHKATNELGSYLDASQATNWKDFRQSFENFGVAGLNLTYADKKGNIGYLPAAQLPVLKKGNEFLNLVKSKDNTVQSYKGTLDFPYSFNPKQGYLASANNMPFHTVPPLSLVNSQGDRMSRFNEKLSAANNWTVEDLKKLQQDTFSQMSFQLKTAFVSLLKKMGSLADSFHFQELSRWDGHYRAQSKGPVIFEILAWNLGKPLFQEKVLNKKLRKLLYSSDMWRDFLWDQWSGLSVKDQSVKLLKAWKKSLRHFKRFKNWGDMHPITVQSPMGFVPVMGKKFRWKTFPSSGGATTIHKASFQPGVRRKKVAYGAQSRHISDLSDLDENYFVLLGGNDGWAGSPAIVDQVDLWSRGDYLKIPLSEKGVQETMTFYKHSISPQKNF